MMYMHYCKHCSRIHMLNGHKMCCPRCENTLTELRIPYIEFVYMDPEARRVVLDKCSDPTLLKGISTNYRMFKYSKWYKKLQDEAHDEQEQQ